MEKFVPCEKCKNGWIYKEDDIEKCKCYTEYQNKVVIQELIKESNIPESSLNYKIEQYIGPDENNNLVKIKKYIDEFDSKFKRIPLYIYGPNSTQKTTTSYYIGKRILEKGFSVYYILMNDIIKDLTNLQFKPELQEKIDKIFSVDLLIIDESFDLSKITIFQSGYQIPYLDNFLRIRLEKDRKSTIFVTNIDNKEISDKFGLSIKSLVERNCKNSILIFKDSLILRNTFNVVDLWN